MTARFDPRRQIQTFRREESLHIEMSVQPLLPRSGPKNVAPGAGGRFPGEASPGRGERVAAESFAPSGLSVCEQRSPRACAWLAPGATFLGRSAAGKHRQRSPKCPNSRPPSAASRIGLWPRSPASYVCCCWAARRFNSSGGTSSTCVATCQVWPNGSSRLPVRSP